MIMYYYLNKLAYWNLFMEVSLQLLLFTVMYTSHYYILHSEICSLLKCFVMYTVDVWYSAWPPCCCSYRYVWCLFWLWRTHPVHPGFDGKLSYIVIFLHNKHFNMLSVYCKWEHNKNIVKLLVVLVKIVKLVWMAY